MKKQTKKKTKTRYRRKRKHDIRYFVTVFGAATAVSLLLIAVIMGAAGVLRPATVQTVNEEEALDYSRITVEKPEIQKQLLTKNVNSRSGKKLTQVNGVVVHYTANPGTDAEANRNYFESRKDCPDEAKYKVSSHYIIGLDGTIIKCIPETEIAYASNSRNKDTISIECCHPDETGKFNAATYQSLIALTAYLCAKYELGTEDVIRHYDVTGKNCPKYYVEHPEAWEEFLADLKQYLWDRTE